MPLCFPNFRNYKSWLIDQVCSGEFNSYMYELALINRAQKQWNAWLADSCFLGSLHAAVSLFGIVFAVVIEYKNKQFYEMYF